MAPFAAVALATPAISPAAAAGMVAGCSGLERRALGDRGGKDACEGGDEEDGGELHV